jgi:hypothetical protein
MSSSAKQRKSKHCYSSRCSADAQETLRSVKIEAEHLKEKLQKSVIDNPQFAKKAAVLISLWVTGRTNKRSGK